MPKRKAPRAIWIAEVVVSQPTEAKIRDKHGLDANVIAKLLKSPPPKPGEYVTDKERGSRLLVKVTVQRRGTVLAVLRPLGDDLWRLVSAYVVTRPRRA